jgi:hypothetical protein
MRKILLLLCVLALAVPAMAQTFGGTNLGELRLSEESNLAPLPWGGTERLVNTVMWPAELEIGDDNVAHLRRWGEANLSENDSPYGTNIDECRGISLAGSYEEWTIPYDEAYQGWILFAPLSDGGYQFWRLQWTGEWPGTFTIGFANLVDGFMVPDENRVTYVFKFTDDVTPMCSRDGGKRRR